MRVSASTPPLDTRKPPRFLPLLPLPLPLHPLAPPLPPVAAATAVSICAPSHTLTGISPGTNGWSIDRGGLDPAQAGGGWIVSPGADTPPSMTPQV